MRSRSRPRRFPRRSGSTYVKNNLRLCWFNYARSFLAGRSRLLPKHPMAEAVNYALGQWTELNAFCLDGAVPIDNNISEREIKRVVLNRKNSLFVGNPRGGRTASILASLTSTCRRHDVDPQLYLTQLLVNLPSAPISELSAWLPDRWKLRQSARTLTP